MNANYLAIVLWVGSLLVQFGIYMWLAARQRGRDEIKMEEISELKEDTMQQRLMLENIATYLETKNGITFRRN